MKIKYNADELIFRTIQGGSMALNIEKKREFWDNFKQNFRFSNLISRIYKINTEFYASCFLINLKNICMSLAKSLK